MMHRYKDCIDIHVVNGCICIVIHCEAVSATSHFIAPSARTTLAGAMARHDEESQHQWEQGDDERGRDQHGRDERSFRDECTTKQGDDEHRGNDERGRDECGRDERSKRDECSRPDFEGAHQPLRQIPGIRQVKWTRCPTCAAHLWLGYSMASWKEWHRNGWRDAEIIAVAKTLGIRIEGDDDSEQPSQKRMRAQEPATDAQSSDP